MGCFPSTTVQHEGRSIHCGGDCSQHFREGQNFSPPRVWLRGSSDGGGVEKEQKIVVLDAGMKEEGGKRRRRKCTTQKQEPPE